MRILVLAWLVSAAPSAAVTLVSAPNLQLAPATAALTADPARDPAPSPAPSAGTGAVTLSIPDALAAMPSRLHWPTLAGLIVIASGLVALLARRRDSADSVTA